MNLNELALDLSNTFGLIGLAILIANLSIGLAIWAQLKIPLPKKLTALKAHKLTAYLALLFILGHIFLIPLITLSKYRWKDLLLPLWTEHQPIQQTLGAVALYLLLIVLVSSYFRKRLNYKFWRTLHYLAYAIAPLLLVHGLFTDPTLKTTTIDFIDGEKIIVEVYGLIFIALIVFRWKLKTLKAQSSRKP